MAKYINIHAHRPAQTIEELVLQNLMAEDYPPDDLHAGYYSVGLHPYSLGKVDEQEALNKVRLALENPRVLAVGECGLDKTLDVSLERQGVLFELQVELAEQADVPVILHVVRSHQEILDFMKKHRPSVPMIIHGFSGSPQLALDLARAGLTLSFGDALRDDRPKVEDAFRALPLEHILLESDEGREDIRELYALGAELKNMDPEVFRREVTERALGLFPGWAHRI
ncbi:MAG: TatD family hydrolase [Bacteroidales bacterium]